MNEYRICSLSEVGTIVSGATPRTAEEDNFGGNIPWITPADLSGYSAKYISHGARSLTEKGYNSCATQLMPEGTVLFFSCFPIGYVAIASNPICTNQGFKSIIPNKSILSEYLYYQLKYLKKHIQDLGSGTTFKEISAKKLSTVQVVVPSISEQRRIVAQIEELFSELDAGVETLQKIKQQLIVYQQAIITSSFSEATGSDSVRLDEISAITGGITKGRDLTGKDVIELPYLRVANVQNGFLDLSEMKKIQLCRDEKDKYLLEYGDVLFTEGGDRDKLGRGTIWRNEIPECVHQNHIFKARIDKSKAIPEYVAYWAMSTPARNYFYEKGKQSVNLASINKTILSALTLPLPDVDTQRSIVDHIQARLSNCKEIEQTVDMALQQSAAMRQSILKQAFEGGGGFDD